MKFVILAAIAAVAVAAPQYGYYSLSQDSSEESDEALVYYSGHPVDSSEEFEVAPVQYSAPPPDSSEEVEVAQVHYSALPADSSEEVEVVPILKDERIHLEDGRYNYDVETGNGISLSQSGSPDGNDGAVTKAGQYSYIAPDGTPVVVKFVANENGYQPQSDLLPVAPAFPHPIPQFVLDQIAFAAAEDAARARAGLDSSSEELQVTAYTAPAAPVAPVALAAPTRYYAIAELDSSEEV
ncbi:uncharacterized protein [Panulirus ornatus]|uniref:uncharacterized protein n=1 Tax=Panulirus ornatus TaxID=150431 RepID=UPI003A89816A